MLGHGDSFFFFFKQFEELPKWQHNYTLSLLAVNEGSNFSISLPTLRIFFYSIQSSGCEVVSHCDFDLHFTNDQLC